MEFKTEKVSPAAEALETERLLQIQQLDTERIWDEEAGLIMRKESDNPDYEKLLTQLLEKYDRSTYDEPRQCIENVGEMGMWTKIIFEIIDDPILNAELKKIETIESIQKAWYLEREEEFLKRYPNHLFSHEAQKSQLLLLYKLFHYTPSHFWYKKSVPEFISQEEYDNERKLIVILWATIFNSIKRKRIKVLRERLERALPEIQEVKNKIIAYDGDVISEQALQRVREIPVIFGDEYIEYGTIYEYGRGVYMDDAQPPYVRVSGKTTLDSSLTRRNISHELLHVRSGHGESAGVTSSDSDRHVVAQRRIGIYSPGTPSTCWFNEAITEEKNGALMDVPRNERSYPKSRKIKDAFESALQIDQKDIDEWYGTEGDDMLIVTKLKQKYPNLFVVLERIEELKNRLLQESDRRNIFNSIEDLSDEDLGKIIEMIHSFGDSN